MVSIRRTPSSKPDRKTAKPDRKVARATKKAARRERWSQLRQAWTLTRKNDPRTPYFVLGTALAVFAVLLALGFLLHHPVYFGVFGLMLGVLAGMALFARRAQRAAFGQVEGQPGAAVAVVQSMRGMWLVTPVVAANRNQDLVHRVIGRPGIILIGEGNHARVNQLIGQEKKRVNRVAADTPVYDLIVGNDAGEIPLRKLQTHLTKLPRNYKPAQARVVEGRLKALGAAKPPVPQGPLPRSARMPRGRTR